MKKVLFSFSLIISVLSFYGCSKSLDNVPTTSILPPAKPTSLQITTTDTLGNALAGAKVILYASAEDQSIDSNAVDSGFTNQSGVVKFESLPVKKYFWSASMECENNAFGSNTTNTLNAGELNSATTVLSGTGTLEFRNNNVDSFSIFVNGKFFGIVAGKTTTYFNHAKLGAYSIRILEHITYSVPVIPVIPVIPIMPIIPIIPGIPGEPGLPVIILPVIPVMPVVPVAPMPIDQTFTGTLGCGGLFVVTCTEPS